ncbi:23S rRNA pseudouridylate synthase [Buchnera aphidicola (Melanaphis sacchari)]|uniref:Pseudouridine synthase n=1 Tax=Buchnera aphidicola (Melanaphis sacchari) TaxID=2173854 RepID=A0A2U8DFC2_9GAMM|nr:pseudouridine synthase [Buchnera aphidicola]AWH90506.1 23S rRNA pseudouridylate synthase [Buchnera aphidicola (Melanaphis sacchari)]
MTEKIQKILSGLGYGSRRFIESMIKNGNIFINKKKIKIGQLLDKKNIKEIFLNDKKVVFKKTKIKKKVIIYNKPIGEICTKNDFKKRATVFDKLPILTLNRWISIGRLDINTKGLLLFTNDGSLANELMHPKNQIEREYHVRIFGEMNEKKINILQRGIKIKCGYSFFKSIKPLYTKNIGKNKWFKIILCEGKNREIRLMCKAVQCEVNRLIRVRYGNIILPNNLKEGQWVKLNQSCLKKLYNLVSIKNK